MAITISGNGIVEANIADGAVTSAKLATNSVDSAELIDGAVDNSHLATGIDATKLADGTINNSELQYINSLSSNAQTQISAAGANIKNGMTDFDLSSASDTKVVVTGLGFTPTHIILQVVMSGTTQMVAMSMMGTVTRSIVTGPAATTGTYTWNNDPQLLTGDGIFNMLDLESLDADGFTLGNTKYNSPTGTAKIQWMAFG